MKKKRILYGANCVECDIKYFHLPYWWVFLFWFRHMWKLHHVHIWYMGEKENIG